MKSFRILRIAGLHYKSLMDSLLERRAELEGRSYQEQQDFLFENEYVYSNAFSRGMRAMGHDAAEVIYDFDLLQKTWADENGIKYDPRRWQTHIVLAQISHFRPDILYFQDIHSLPYAVRRDIKNLFPFLKLCIVFRGYPGISPTVVKEMSTADILLVGSPILVHNLTKAGLHPILVYHSFNDSVLRKISNDNKQDNDAKYDFTFVGSSGYGYGSAHQHRYRTLIELMNKTTLEAWVDDRLPPQKTFRMQLESRICDSIKKTISYKGIEKLRTIQWLAIAPLKLRRLIRKMIEEEESAFENAGHATEATFGAKLPPKPLRQIFSQRCHLPVFGIEMYKVLRQSKVTFNKHTVAALGTIDNIRLFDATGVGTCLLTDTGRNISDLFKENHEVVTYSTIDECIEKLNYLLEHHDLREKIAKAGQRRTLNEHTTTNRCQQIDDIIQEIL